MKILAIRTHRMGDVLQLTPMLAGLKKRYPESTVTFLTGTDMEPLLSRNPHLDEILTIPEKEYRYFLKERPERYAHVYNRMYDLIGTLKKRNFSLIINRQYEVGSVLASLTGCRDIRGGAYTPQRGFFFPDDPSRRLYECIRRDRKANRRNLADWACHIAGLEPGCGRMAFCLSDRDRREADVLLNRNGIGNDERPVAVQMGAARSFRQWGTENFVALIRRLIAATHASILLLGSSAERDQAAQARRDLGRAADGVVDLTGKTTLKALGGVLERCRYLITGDTGTMHMAAAVGTPVIAIFYGTAYPWETAPYGTGHLVLFANEPCAPCLDPADCTSGQKCRRAITPEDVGDACAIAEGAGQHGTAPSWERDGVSLFATVVPPGGDQVLVPIGELAGGLPVDSYRRKRTGRQANGTQAEEISRGCLRDEGERILRQFYRGAMDDFLAALPGYVDQWSNLLASRYGGPAGGSHPPGLEDLAPALHQACRAMEARDYVTFVDMIRYRFAPFLASGMQDAGAGGRGE